MNVSTNTSLMLATRNLIRLGICLALLVLFLMRAQPAAAGSCEVEHTVHHGETLWHIGRFYDVEWPAIANENNIANPDVIQPNQILCIQPGAATSGDTPEGTASNTGSDSGSDAATVDRPASAVATTGVLRVPNFTISAVTRDESIEIQGRNFPAGASFQVRMGAMWTRGVNGVIVTTVEADADGEISASFDIPEALEGQARISIRLEGTAGYFSYNWFYNSTTAR